MAVFIRVEFDTEDQGENHDMSLIKFEVNGDEPVATEEGFIGYYKLKDEDEFAEFIEALETHDYSYFKADEVDESDVPHHD